MGLNGALYVSPIPLNSSGQIPAVNQASQYVFTYQPGGTIVPGRTYTSFTAMMADRPNAPCKFIFDTEFGAAVIPSGTWFKNGDILSAAYQDTVSFADGAHIAPAITLLYIEGGLILQAAGSSAVWTPTTSFALLVQQEQSSIQGGASAPFLHLTSAASPMTHLLLSESAVGFGTLNALTVDSGATLTTYAFQFSNLQLHAAGGTGTWHAIYDSSVGVNAQADITTFTKTLADISTNVGYTPVTSSNWHATVPTTVKAALDVIATGSIGQFGLSYVASSKSVATTGNVTLLAADYQPPVIRLTGTLTGSVTVIFPNNAGMWFVDVSAVTLGGNTLTFKSGTASTAAIAALTTTSQIFMIVTTGSNGIAINV